MSDTDIPIPRECRKLIRGGALIAITLAARTARR